MRPVPLATVFQLVRSGYWGADAGTADHDVRIIRNGDLGSNGTIRWDKLPLRAVTRDELRKAHVRKGDILLTASGDCGFVAHLNEEPDHSTCASNFIRLLRVDEDEVHSRYVFHYMAQATCREAFAPFIRGSTLKNLSVGAALEAVFIPLPSLPEQRRIAAILDQAEALQIKRQAATANLNEMAQAIFGEMFGEPERNPKHFEIIELGQLIDNGPQNGIYKPANFYGEGTPIVRIDTFYNGSFKNIRNLKRLRLSTQEENTYGLQEGDIVINRVNSDEYLGKSAIVPSLPEATVFESNMMRLSLKRARAEPVYVIHALQTPYTRKQIRAAAKDAVNQSSINQKDVARFRLLCPPLDQQRAFVERIALVERVKKEQERAGTVCSSLFASLQHRAFTGAL